MLSEGHIDVDYHTDAAREVAVGLDLGGASSWLY